MALIKCDMCGSVVSDTARECPNCGCSIVPATVPQNAQGNYYSETEPSYEYMKKFNWGAFLLTPFWCLFNGMWWAALAYLIVSATGFGSIASLVASIYLGFNGSQLSWKYKQWDNVENFYRTQDAWKKWAFIITGVSIGLLILFLIIIVAAD